MLGILSLVVVETDWKFSWSVRISSVGSGSIGSGVKWSVNPGGYIN